MQVSRTANVHVILFPAGSSVSNVLNLDTGGFAGSFIVPSGSEAIGKSINITELGPVDLVDFPPTNLLSAAKTLAAGANALSATELNQAGAATRCRFQLSAPTIAATTIYLMWKS